MAELSLLAWVLLVLGALFVGFSKGALPGASAVSVAIFAALLPARESTGAMLLLFIVGDVFAVAMYRKHADWPTLLRLISTVLGGVLLGVAFLYFADDEVVRRVIGAILLLIIAITLARRRREWQPPPAEPTGGGRQVSRVQRLGQRLRPATYGTLAGFTTMAANAGGPVMSMYLITARFSVKRFLGTAAWFFAIVNLIKLPFSAGLGLITGPLLLLDLVLVPAVLVGGFVGRWLVEHMDQKVFDRLVIALTIIGSIYLLV